MTHEHCDLRSNQVQTETCLSPSPRKNPKYTTLFVSLFEETPFNHCSHPMRLYILPYFHFSHWHWKILLFSTAVYQGLDSFKSEVALVIAELRSWFPNEVCCLESLQTTALKTSFCMAGPYLLILILSNTSIGST